MAFKALIMDEDPKWQNRLRAALETQVGCDVTIADNYSDAITELENADPPFDLVTVDMDIPFNSSKESSLLYALGYKIVAHVHTYNRGELCVILSGSKLTLDYLDKITQFQSVLIGSFKKEDGFDEFNEFTDRIRKRLMTRKLNFFISYRRQDSQDVTGRIYDRLSDYFGDRNIFYDQDTIPLGTQFPQRIKDAIHRSSAVLAVIGPHWASMRKEGESEPRLFNPDDFVRVELQEAHLNQIPVIPLLVNDAEMPLSRELPAELRWLAEQNGMEIHSDAAFKSDMELLIERLTLALNR